MNQIKLKNAVRTLSGVTPVAVLTKPYPCPGRCIFCPQEDNVPQSYLAKEPAVMRAILSKYDPKLQTEHRLKQYQQTGHSTQKIEFIILGGTWSAYPKPYQTTFVKECLEGLNQEKSKTLAEAIKKNETAHHRMIGLSIETRPDLINHSEIKRLRELGVTKVELGVQTTDNKILKKIKRQHGIKESIRATRMLKDAGFKVLYHIMPGLPGSSPQEDLKVFKTLFSSPDYQPDMLKIYPCVVTQGTEIHQWFKQGKYKPYKSSELTALLSKIKKNIPSYVRIMRLYRDIPAHYIIGGSITSNMRQVVQRQMRKKNLKCRCIRCREIKDQAQEKDLKLERIRYQASGGEEIFFQWIDKKDRIYALLRLRISSSIYSQEKPLFRVLNNSSIIREVHVYGPATDLKQKGKVQHGGLGRKLIREAEKISQKEFGLEKIAVISGVGVREYYRKLGYHLEQTYMIKKLV